MRYFIRFTNTIELDIKRGTSVLTHDKNGIEIKGGLVVYGLCAFGSFETIEDCHREAKRKHRILGGTKDYAVIRGVRSEIEGSLGCVVEEPELVSKHSL